MTNVRNNIYAWGIYGNFHITPSDVQSLITPNIDEIFITVDAVIDITIWDFYEKICA